MEQVKYSYCVDEKGNLVHVRSLTPATRHAHKLYCLQCGQEMIPNLGEKKAWYFSHKAETACDGESYLHKLAKRRIREKFLNEESFPITFCRDVPCSESKECPCCSEKYICQRQDVEIPGDLKIWKGKLLYDTCREEIPFDGFRPDLLLTCSTKPGREPIFIEVFKTHQSNEKKVNSSYKIIETNEIKTEEDIEDILNRGFVEGDNCTTYNFNPQLPSIRITDNPIDRFVLFKSGAAIVYKAVDYVVTCDKINLYCHRNSEIELNMRGQGIDIWGDNAESGKLDSYQKGLVYLVKKGMTIRNCILCKFYKYNDYYSSPMCILYKKIGLESPFPKQTVANSCQQFELSQELLSHSLAELEKEVSIIPKVQ